MSCIWLERVGGGCLTGEDRHSSDDHKPDPSNDAVPNEDLQSSPRSVWLLLHMTAFYVILRLRQIPCFSSIFFINGVTRAQTFFSPIFANMEAGSKRQKEAISY